MDTIHKIKSIIHVHTYVHNKVQHQFIKYKQGTSTHEQHYTCMYMQNFTFQSVFCNSNSTENKIIEILKYLEVKQF